MTSILAGAGGWAYFHVPGESSLSAYSRTFDFVEINSSYYQALSPRLVLRWKESVPSKLQFSVRCNRRLIEQYCGQKGEGDERDRLLRMVRETCRILAAPVLVVLVNGSGPTTVAGLDSLLSDLDLGKETRVAVELREDDEPAREFFGVLERNGCVHCVDISRGESPRVDSDLLYSRLFGKGDGNIYEFDDNELKDITGKASSPAFEKSILAFHGVRMYRDAARLKTYLATGSFPRLTGETGLDAFEKVIGEDTVYPVTKQELLQRQGWKLFDLTADRRVRTRIFLEKLPDNTVFRDTRMVREHLERS